MKLYSDLGDVAKKLLSDDFISGTKLKISSKTADGKTFTVNGASSDKSDDLAGDLSVKFKHKGVTGTAKIPTASNPKLELVYDHVDPNGPRTSVTLTGSTPIVPSLADSTAIAKVELIKPKLGLELEADILQRTVAASIATAVVPGHYGAFAVVGAGGILDVSKGELRTPTVTASLFDGRESEVSVEVEGKADAATLGYSHLVRPGLSVAGKMRYHRETQSAVGAMGVAAKLDGATTVKAKLETGGTAYLSYIQNIRPGTKVIMSAAFNAATLDSTKLGLSVTLG